ncbi:unnamed protein product [Ectocarpus sp. 12 AP-2014]
MSKPTPTRNAFRIHFICDRPGTPATEVAHDRGDGGGGAKATWAEIARKLRCFGATAIQRGVDLKDCTVPSPNHDIFVLTRPDSTAAAGRSPTKLVAFREPGGRIFHLELPLNSSLAGVKASLMSASRAFRRKAQETLGRPHQQVRQMQQHVPKQTVASANVHDDQDCTLIVGGNKMSSSCLLGDYLIKDSVTRARRREPAKAVVLVLWHPPRQEQDVRRAAAAARKHYPRRAAAATTPRATSTCNTRLQRQPDALRQACAAGRRGGEPQDRGTTRESSRRESGRLGEARRSVQRRCKSVARFSGMRRGARCGMGIRPLS